MNVFILLTEKTIWRYYARIQPAKRDTQIVVAFES